jgi:glucose-6-phosphate isomerase
MNDLQISLKDALGFVESQAFEQYKPQTQRIISTLEQKSDDPDQYLGWMNLPQSIRQDELDEIRDTAGEFTQYLDAVVVIGIGGSYLGAKAVIEALSSHFPKESDAPEILFAGHHLDEDYHHELLERLDNLQYGIIVISKSGTTTEPGIAFRILKKHLEEKAGIQAASQRIIAITDKKKGALRKLAKEKGYQSYVIPDDVGGRYSVLTPVGLVPVAMGGYDIHRLIAGANAMREKTTSSIPFDENPASLYAAMRNALYHKGKTIELLGIYQPKLYFLMEWWKQLYGESEGKEYKGIFPSIAQFTTDLHSMGQYIQEGRRILFETILSVEETHHQLRVPEYPDDTDKLNYLGNKRMHEVNTMAENGTRLAHTDGDVPNITVSIPQIDEYYLGQLIYFFEKACAISGYILDVNPFDQPGVEAYKSNMFALLGKPGYETESKRLWDRLNKNKR